MSYRAGVNNKDQGKDLLTQGPPSIYDMKAMYDDFMIIHLEHHLFAQTYFQHQCVAKAIDLDVQLSSSTKVTTKKDLV